MKLNANSITGDLDRCGVALADRGPLLAIAFAQAVGYKLPLPAEPVENPYQFFIETHKAATEQILGDLNERCVVNIDAAADLTQRVWIFRYRLLHDAQNTAVRDFLDALIRAGSREIPPTVSELLTRCGDGDALASVRRVLLDGFEGA